MPSFQYSDLDSENIRFLALHPGTPEDPLAGILFVDDLDQELPYYEALSYCWGDQSSPETISLAERVWSGEKGDLEIGQNLAAALRRLRHHQQERIIWCDAICINQQNLAERSSQVKRMSEIYSLAAKVIIWLGPETSWCSTAMDTLRWADNQIKSINRSFEHNGMYLKFRDTADPRMNDPINPLPLSTEQWIAIEYLLDLDWHKRLWTLQEVALADQGTCTVVFGHEEMLWMTFKNTLIFVSHYKQPAPDSRLDLIRYESNATTFGLKALRTNYTSDYTWITAIARSSEFQCTDDRDKVFACRGLIIPEAADAIEVDYTKSTKEVFTSVCLDALFREQSLEFLDLCNGSISPSWVADLAKPLALALTDGNVAPNSIPEARLVEAGVLEVAGVVCDELAGAPILIPVKDNFLHTPAEYLQVMANAVQSLCSEELLNDDTQLDPLIMALTYGSVRDYYIETLYPEDRSPLRSIVDWRNKLRGLMNSDLEDGHVVVDSRFPDETYIRSIPGGLYASGCLKIRNGCFIRVPPESLKGDLVAVLLGLDRPLVLRPGTKPNTYSVIGTCYHPGLADGSALLGNDFAGWERLWDRGHFQNAFHKDGIVRYTDPRLDNVPVEDGYYEIIKTIKGRRIPLWLHKDIHVENVFKDPRMKEEALLKRGVPVKRLQLI